MNRAFGISIYVLVVPFLLSCFESATNPYEKAENIDVSITLDDRTESGNIIAGDTLRIGVVPQVGHLVDSVTVDISPDTALVFYPNQGSSTWDSTLWFDLSFSSPGEKQVIAAAYYKGTGRGIDTALVDVAGRPAAAVRINEFVQVSEGDTALIRVRVSGSAPLACSWMKNNAMLSDSAAGDTLRIAGVLRSDSGSYRCIASNPFGDPDTSRPVKLIVTPVDLTITATSSLGGSISPAGAVDVALGGNVSFSISADTGYYCAGLQVDGTDFDGDSTHAFEGVVTDHTIHAVFNLKHYTLTVSAQGIGMVSPEGDTSIAHGTPLAISASPIGGNRFSAWRVVEGAASIADTANAVTTVTLTGNAAVRAHFFPAAASNPETPSYTISFDSPGGDAPESQTIDSGATATKPLPPPSRDGYTFAGWFKEKSCINEWSFDERPVTQDRTLYGKWIQNSRVMYHGNGNTGGSVPADDTTYTPGSKVTVLDNSGNLVKTGHSFTGWNTGADGSGTGCRPGATLTVGVSTVDLYAQWAAKKYTVTFDSRQGSPIQPQTVEHGQAAAEPASPERNGYTFAGWFKDEQYNYSWDFAGQPVTANVTLYAKWKMNEYTVTFNTQGGSTIAPHVISHGEKAPEPEKPAWNGHTFMGWFKEAVCTNEWDFSSNIITADVTIYAKWLENPPGMKLIFAADSSFQMGSNYRDETKPVHTVSFIRNFWMDTTEVTIRQFEKLLKVLPDEIADETNTNKPVCYITWYDAVFYANARSEHYGLESVYTYTQWSGIPGNGSIIIDLDIDYSKNGYRLPTEAEWEYACRAGSTSEYFWGNDSARAMDYAWYGDNSEYNSYPVAKKNPNPFGLYDLTGNVWEWCNDWYSVYSANAQIDPKGQIIENGNKVIRGGGCIYLVIRLRSASRLALDPGTGTNDNGDGVGFRLVLPAR